MMVRSKEEGRGTRDEGRGTKDKVKSNRDVFYRKKYYQEVLSVNGFKEFELGAMTPHNYLDI